MNPDLRAVGVNSVALLTLPELPGGKGGGAVVACLRAVGDDSALLLAPPELAFPKLAADSRHPDAVRHRQCGVTRSGEWLREGGWPGRGCSFPAVWKAVSWWMLMQLSRGSSPSANKIREVGGGLKYG